MGNFYDSTELLKKKDLDGEKPSIYMIISNRSGGKTTHFLKKSLELFKEKHRKTILLYRRNYELPASGLVYSDVLKLFPEYGKEIETRPIAKGLFYELFLDGESMGFSISLNNVDSLKKYSPLFSDCDLFIFDEFLTENGQYLPHEVENLQSVLITCARGGGEQSREIELFMLSNRTSLLNPYFIYFGIHKRLREDTHFMRGHGWIAEFTFIKSASEAIKKNGIYKAFNNEKNAYMNYSTETVYLKDTSAFIEHISGKNQYLFTFIYEGDYFSIREYVDIGILYVSEKIDKNFKTVISFKPNDHNQNTILLSRYSSLWKYVKEAFNGGFLRFDSLKAKNAIFDILSIDLYK